MKQKYILYGLLTLLGTGCSNQDLEEKWTYESGVQVTAGIADSRVSFNEGENTTYAYWQDGDAITLNTPSQGNLNYIASVSKEDATTATFSPQDNGLKDIDGETVHAVYPAAEITEGSVVLPATESWTEGKTLPFAYAISSIQSSKVDLQFKHIFTFLKLTVTAEALADATSIDGDKSIHQIVVKSAGDALGVRKGTFSFDTQKANITETSDSIAFTLTEAFNPESETERGIYLPLLPVSADTEISIYLQHKNAEGKFSTIHEVVKKTPARGFEAGHVYTLKLAGTTKPSSGTIEGEKGEIYLSAGGELSKFITNENKYTIKSLKLSGYLNGDDIRLLREMAGRYSNGDKTDGSLTDLDVADATIVEGGGSYYFSNYTKNNVWGDSFFIKTNLKNVVLPRNITVIESQAFEDCSSLETVIMSEGITSIGHWAFRECESLKSIAIPNSVLIIGDRAFEGCSVETITFSEESALTTIDHGAFSGAGLQTVTLPESLTTIGDSAFSGCSSLVSINIPNAVTAIGEFAFYGCSSLARCSMGSSVSSIGEEAFSYCEALVAISIPEGITTIESSTFSDCKSLNTIVIPDGVVSIGNYSFSGCTSLKNVTIGKGVKSIGAAAFSGCAFDTIVIPDNVVSIGSSAFVSSKLSSISLGNGLESIETEAFFGCELLKSITIPESVTYMGYDVFARCYSLTEAYNVLVDNYYVFGSGMFAGAPLQKVTINKKSRKIALDTFYGCGTLTEIVIPENITEIGNSAFEYCKSLKSITIPNSVTSIGTRAFASCTALESAILPDNITKVPLSLFEYCETLKEIVIPNAVITIDASAFRRCYSLSKVILGKNITTMGTNAFESCPILECVSYSAIAPVMQSTTFTASKIDKETAKLYVPKGSLTAYQESDWATYFSNIIEMEE